MDSFNPKKQRSSQEKIISDETARYICEKDKTQAENTAINYDFDKGDPPVAPKVGPQISTGIPNCTSTTPSTKGSQIRVNLDLMNTQVSGTQGSRQCFDDLTQTRKDFCVPGAAPVDIKETVKAMPPTDSITSHMNDEIKRVIGGIPKNWDTEVNLPTAPIHIPPNNT